MAVAVATARLPVLPENGEPHADDGVQGPWRYQPCRPVVRRRQPTWHPRLYDGQPWPVAGLCRTTVRRTLCPCGAPAEQPRQGGCHASLGAELVEHGRDYDEARVHCEEIQRREGMRYVHSADEPH